MSKLLEDLISEADPAWIKKIIHELLRENAMWEGIRIAELPIPPTEEVDVESWPRKTWADDDDDIFQIVETGDGALVQVRETELVSRTPRVFMNKPMLVSIGLYMLKLAMSLENKPDEP